MYIYIDGDGLDEDWADEGRADDGRANDDRAFPGRDLLAVSAFALGGLAVALGMAAAFPPALELTQLLVVFS